MAEYWSTNESLAEMHVFEALSNLARMSYDALSNFKDFIGVLDSDDERAIVNLYERIRGLKNRVEETKMMVMEYIVRLSRTLEAKDMYASIALSLDKTVQKIDGAAYRLYMMKLNKFVFDEKLHSRLMEFIQKIVDEFQTLYNGLTRLRSAPRKAIQDMNLVVKLEEEIDRMYRENEIELFKSLSNNIPALMLVKEAMDFVEDVADIIKEVAETIRYLALHRVSLE